MLDTVCQKAAAKNQMLNTAVCKIKCQRNVSMVYQVYQHTVMNYKKTKEKSESVTVP